MITSRASQNRPSAVWQGEVVSSESLVWSTRKHAAFWRCFWRTSSETLSPTASTQSARLSQQWMWCTLWRGRDAPCMVSAASWIQSPMANKNGSFKSHHNLKKEMLSLIKWNSHCVRKHYPVNAKSLQAYHSTWHMLFFSFNFITLDMDHLFELSPKLFQFLNLLSL